MGNRTYPGKIIEKMPELIKSGKLPMSIYDHILWRIAALKSGNEKWIDKACNHNYDSGDVIFTGGYKQLSKYSGRVIVSLDSQIGRELKVGVEIFQGGICLTDEEFVKEYRLVKGSKSANGLVLRKDEVDNLILNEYQTKEDTVKNKIKLGLVRNDVDALNDYFDLSIDYLASKGFKYSTLMGVSIKTKPDLNVGYFISISKLMPNGSSIHASISVEGSGGNLRGKYNKLAKF